MATSVLIVQHGEKEPTGGDPGLTPIGWEQASATARAFARDGPPSALYSSPLRRAAMTAAPIAELFGLPVRIDDRLRERMNWAGDDTRSLDSFLAEWAQASTDRTFVPSTGDSSLEAGRRFHEALDEIAMRHAGVTIVVVTHGGVTVDLLRTVIGDAKVTAAGATLIEDGVPNCAITGLEHRHGRWHVRQIASIDHLARSAGPPEG